MRHIDRLSIPEVISKNYINWTKIFLESGKARPSNNQYAHKEIIASLNTMSSYKCFYCERILKGGSKEVDHYIEVSECKHLSFFWQNLYLACDNCNDKFSNKTIPAASTLDPCFHTDKEIEDNLVFENELVRPKANSNLGEMYPTGRAHS
jgi:5-methylcytosine-specific restriction endonuclease McrA